MIWGCEGIIPSARGYIQNGEPRLGQGCLKWEQFGAGWWFRGLLKTFTVLAERQGVTHGFLVGQTGLREEWVVSGRIMRLRWDMSGQRASAQGAARGTRNTQGAPLAASRAVPLK